MAIPILGEIERLITEHGSATILRERLALAADQFSLLQKENEALKAEKSILASENERLKLDNAECQKQKRNLEEKLSDKRHKDLLKEQLLVNKLNDEIL